MNKPIPEFTKTEITTIETTLAERYGEPVEIQLADTEIRLDSYVRELTSCPAVYWKAGKCNFLVIKTGQQTYRCQFFYSVRHEYGTGIKEYNDLLDCLVSLLRVQADHERELSAESNTQSSV